jgi:hypothetical protein
MTRAAFTLIVVILTGFSFAGSSHGAAPLHLRSREKLAAPSPLTNAVYLKPTGLELLAAGGFSPDNGRTWQPFTPKPDFDSKLQYGFRRERHPLFVDTSTGRVLSVINAMDTPGIDPAAIEPKIALEAYYLRYRVSKDAGRTYLFDEPIVEHGGKHTPDHPLDGVWKGKNALFMGDCGSLPLRTREGKILLPAQACVLGNDGKLSKPGGVLTYTDVRVLIGTWTKDDHLDWDAAEPVSIDPARSTRGMIEPTLAELPDGAILMVMRGSNGGAYDPKVFLPSYKWFSTSSDGGRHWTKPAPWTYSDGSNFFSPSSMSQLIPHSSGRLFWIGNITSSNPRGNAPRYPLVVGEVDTKSGLLVRESVIAIDDLRPEDKAGVELSPHAATFEDRETGDVVLPTLRHSGRYKSSEPYVYRISIK